MQNSMRTYARQTLLFGEDESTSLQAVSPASLSALQANAKARRTTATSGRKCLEQFGRFALAGSWARTFSELLIGRGEWFSNRCALTWRLAGTKSNRIYFRLVPSALPTEGTDAGSLPIILKTPSAFDATVTSPKKNPVPGNSGSLAQEIMCGYAARRGLLPTVQTQGLKQCKNGKTVFMPSSLLPTPRASKITGGDRADFSPSLPGLMLKGMLPTPKANDFRSGMPNRVGTKHTQQLNDTVAYRAGQTSQLNPLFVAEMMGLPVDWTVLPFQIGEMNPSKPTETLSCRR